MSDLQALAPTKERATRPIGMGIPGQLVAGVLVVGLAVLAGYSVEQAGWSEMLLPVVRISAMAALFGVLLARTRLPDSMAHVTAMSFGTALTLAMTLRQVVPEDGATGWLARLEELGRAATGWYLGDDLEPILESQLISFLMAAILWLVGYLSAWCLFRRGWVFATVLLPGFLILVNLGFADAPAGPTLVLFGLFSLLLLVRQNLIDQQERWRRRGMPASRQLASGFLFWGSSLAAIATVAAVVAPATVSQATFQPLLDDVSQRATSIQQSASTWLEGVTGQSSGNQVSVSGSFSSFSDSFAIGGPLDLADTPAVLAAADEVPYLGAQTMDAYTGRGWYSTVEDTFVAEGGDGRRYSPEMTFNPNQDVPLSPDVTDKRMSQAVEITPLTPTDGLLYTVDTYQTSSIEASVRMAWRQLDGESFALRNADDLVALPRELRPIATVLLEASFGEDEADGSPVATDPSLQSELMQQRDELARRFLEVTWTADEQGSVASIVVSGQLPVYDDVESVSARTALETNEGYRVVALTSQATAEDLANAGEAYPDWVNERYLPLPETVTARTIDLALEITAPYDNPYDKAKALEAYIRANMIYDETVTAPPGDADIVDYLLFERQRGYCEYSASAMTVMLRAVGIPARLVVGFAPGNYDAERAGFLYLQSDAHAWTEVFFPGYGWIPFEPTPSLATRDEAQTDGQAPLADETPEPTTEAAMPTVAPENDADATPSVPPDDSMSTPAVPGLVEIDDGGGGGVPWMILAAVGVFSVLFGVGWLLWAYPLRNLGAGSSYFFRLRRLGAMMGVRPAASATPREFGRAMADRVPTARRQIEQIVKTYELDQYGPEPADARWLGGAAEAWRSIRHQAPKWLVPRRRRKDAGEGT